MRVSIKFFEKDRGDITGGTYVQKAIRTIFVKNNSSLEEYILDLTDRTGGKYRKMADKNEYQYESEWGTLKIETFKHSGDEL
jgi:hypothetical protein